MNKKEQSTREWLDYHSAADLLGISYHSLVSLVFRDQIPHYRFATRTVKFDRKELLCWLQSKHHISAKISQ